MRSELIAPQLAFQRIQHAWKVKDTETVSSLNALHRILAEDVVCDRDQPPFNRVMMDGYAFHTSQVVAGNPLEVRAIQGAGESVTTTDGVVEIMTGAALPAHCNAVMPYEKCSRNGQYVTFLSNDIKPFMNVHLKGLDKKADDVLLRKNEVIGVSDIATLCAVGKPTVTVFIRPNIALISTGNELVTVNEVPSANQIRSSNKEMLYALLAPFAAEIKLHHLPDDREALKQFLQGESLRYDVLCFSGGVSMGKYDYVASELEAADVHVHFHGVQQRPGKPFFFGTRNEQVIYAFPGNPVSVLHCATRFLLPFLRTSTITEVKLNTAITNPTGLFFYKPVQLNGDGSVEVIQQNGSGDFMGMHGATGFVELAPNDSYKEGERLPYYSFVL